MRLLLGAILVILPTASFADQPKAVYADEAARNGFTLEKSEVNPGVIQVVATLPKETTSVGLILRGRDGQFISSSALEIRGNRCSAILSQAAVGNSSFVTPYITVSEDEMTELYFGKTKAEQGGAHQPTTRAESEIDDD